MQCEARTAPSAIAEDRTGPSPGGGSIAHFVERAAPTLAGAHFNNSFTKRYACTVDVIRRGDGCNNRHVLCASFQFLGDIGFFYSAHYGPWNCKMRSHSINNFRSQSGNCPRLCLSWECRTHIHMACTRSLPGNGFAALAMTCSAINSSPTNLATTWARRTQDGARKAVPHPKKDVTRLL